jgi:transcriptional regulator with XRE-family HTH domain
MTKPSLEKSRFYWERLHAIKRASELTWAQMAAGLGVDPQTLAPFISGPQLARNARRGGSLPHTVVVRLAASLGLSASALYTFLPEPPLSGTSAGFSLFTYCEREDPELGEEIYRVIAATFPTVVRRITPDWGDEDQA